MDRVKIKKRGNPNYPLLEWAVFWHLYSKTDLELILLKGNLILETILEIVLKRNGVINIENYSFYRKILTLESIEVKDKLRKKFIISSLIKINRLRNKVAHEFYFDIANGEFEIWASKILDNLKGEKFSNYTPRTKIVHSFSVLTKNILEIKNSNFQLEKKALTNKINTMDKKTISILHKIKGSVLDDDYTLYDDGTILHEYDKNMYPSGQNLKERLTVSDLSDEVKQRLLKAASDGNKDLVHKILNLHN